MKRIQTEGTKASNAAGVGVSALLVLLALLSFSFPLRAQQPVLPFTNLVNGDTTYFFNLHPLPGSKDLDYDNWSESLDSWVVFLSSYDSTDFIVNISGKCGMAPSPIHGHIDIWDGDPMYGTRVVYNFSDSTLTDTIRIHGHRLTMHIQYDAYSLNNSYSRQRHIGVQWASATPNYQWFEHNGEPQPYSCTGPSWFLLSNSITSSQALLTVTNRDSTTIMRFLGADTPLTSDSILLTGLSPNTRYYITIYDSSTINTPWCWKRCYFTTLPESHHGIPNFEDLSSNYVQGISNNTAGFLCCDPEYSAFSYHTLNHDTLATDGICYDRLRVVPPGKTWSIRLGNWLLRDSESIEYHLHVDTNDYSLIMLYYAAVLQNPDHSPSCQPRFMMQILDSSGTVIDPQCGSADFVASGDLGWYSVPPEVLWKDWTTVGINLIPYHGQDICLRFTTADCCQGGHFGYAYFYAECQQPIATAELCGNVDTNTFTAPDGFYYLWYVGNDTADSISSSQTVTYPTNEGTIRCRLSYIENPSCYLTMNTYISNYWPWAEIDTLRTISHGCMGYEVQFANRSTILGNDSLPLPDRPPCHQARWDFGDGDTSSDYSPTHLYLQPGTYTVTLIASLYGDCTDTTQFTINYTGPGYVETTLPVDTFCYNSTYQWYSFEVGNPYITAPTEYSLRRLVGFTSDGCDSFLVQPLLQLPPDSTLDILQQPNCNGSRYWLTAVTACPVVEWSSAAYDSLLDGNEHDRVVWVEPADDGAVYTLTSFHIYRGDSLFCPTSKSIGLHLINPPNAALKVAPTVLSYANLEVTATDVSADFPTRQWSVCPYPFGDTLRLIETTRTLHYTASADLDSLVVLLAVSNGVCFDTATATLPMVRSALWIPNIFTPSQPSNNRFIIVGGNIQEGTLTVYNRLGLEVYTTTDPAAGWDGTHNGTPCPQGAYPWHFRYRTTIDPDRWHETTGTVTLIR